MKLQKGNYIERYLEKCNIGHVVYEDHILVAGNIPVTSLEVVNGFKFQKDKKPLKKRVITPEAAALKKYVEANFKADKTSDDQRMILRRTESVAHKPIEIEKPKEYKRPPAKYSNPDWNELYSKY